MPEQPSNSPAAIRARLQQVAQLLRQARHLPPEAQTELSALLEELTRALDPAVLPPTEMAHLADSAAHLIQSLNPHHDPGLLAGAKERLEDAVARAEAEAPLAASIARQLLDILANFGI